MELIKFYVQVSFGLLVWTYYWECVFSYWLLSEYW